MESKFKDKILICVDCKEEFAFTIGAQEYFAGRGFTEDPKRCRACYAIFKDAVKQKNRGVKKPERGLPKDVESEETPFRFPDSDVMDSGNGGRPNVE
ncbi:MAG: zinc-ribbon domain containing protein [Candidatus Zixiibacteriota bacterium]